MKGNEKQLKKITRRGWIAPAFVGTGLLAAIALGAGASAFAYSVQHAAEARQKNLQNQMELLQNLMEMSQDDLQSAATRLRDIERRTSIDGAEIADAIAKSVYMLGVKDDEGDFALVGTGFVVENNGRGGLLATNAHVAEVLARAQSEGLSVVARQPGDSPIDLSVSGAPIIHPGYETWSSLPMRNVHMNAVNGVQGFDLLSPADVALVSVTGDLAPALALADDDDLATLRPGNDVIYVGFPAENIVGQHVNTLASRHFGRLINASGFIFEPATAADAVYLHHNINLTGGSSGGPLVAIDRESGEFSVIGVHSAGSFVFTADQRVPVGLGYAQAIDFLHELLSDSAQSVQAERDAEWALMLNRFSAPLTSRLRNIADFHESSWSVDAELVQTWTVDGEDLGADKRFIREWSVVAGATYLIVAGGQNWDDVDVCVWQSNRELDHNVDADGIAWVTIEAPDTGTLTIEVNVPTTYADTEIEVQLYRLR